MGPKSNDKSPYKSEAEIGRGDVGVTTGAKIAVMWPPES